MFAGTNNDNKFLSREIQYSLNSLFIEACKFTYNMKIISVFFYLYKSNLSKP